MKYDPHRSQEKYDNWKARGMPLEGVCYGDAKLIRRYLQDMEQGLNVAGTGALGPSRLYALVTKLRIVTEGMTTVYGEKPLQERTDKEVVGFFNAMRRAEFLTTRGKPYKSLPDYAKAFQAFWHWYQRTEEQRGGAVRDITRYIDKSPQQEHAFVYLTTDEVKRLAQHARYEYRVLIWFLFDSGIRAPTELMNVRVRDLTPMETGGGYVLKISDEAAKTFGRQIKLLLCGSHLEEYIRTEGLAPDEFVFHRIPRVANQYLKRLAVRVFGDRMTKAGKRIGQLTMYDFRHCSACYWVPRYKRSSGYMAMMYRFGWKRMEMIHYYTKLLGMQDTITEDDLLIDGEGKTRLEKDLSQERSDSSMLREQLQAMQRQLA